VASTNETNEAVLAVAGVRINDPGGTDRWPAVLYIESLRQRPRRQGAAL
jgi:hypothetical protein